jgi:hypothetical protein
MDSVWGTHVAASYRAWQAKRSPSLIDVDAKAAAAYRDWKASKDTDIMDLPQQQPEADDEEPVGVGQAVAQAAGIGVQTAQEAGIGKTTAQENEVGKQTAAENQAGQIAARSEGNGRVAAMESGEGKAIAIAKRAGVKTAKAMGIGNMEPAGQISCAPAPNITDAGYHDDFRGWFDIQGCGTCNDYCRWVGASGGGDPFLSQSTASGAFWSCHLAGADDDYTPEDHFSRWMHPKCQGKGFPAICMDAQPEIVDTGFTDAFQGWYDVQGCGTCNDYCRWVGRSGSGGDPKDRLAKGDSWWSCQLAGHESTHTNLGRFGSWSLPKCDGKGAAAP